MLQKLIARNYLLKMYSLHDFRYYTHSYTTEYSTARSELFCFTEQPNLFLFYHTYVVKHAENDGEV